VRGTAEAVTSVTKLSGRSSVGKRLDRVWVRALHRAPDGDDTNEVLSVRHNVVEVTARLFEQKPPHGFSVEVTIDLVLRPAREGDPAVRISSLKSCLASCAHTTTCARREPVPAPLRS
jgi:hypothetical protein